MDLLGLPLLQLQHMIQVIRDVGRLYNFQPLETPAIERLDATAGHPCRLLPRRDKLTRAMADGTILASCEEALREDLKRPLARVLAEHPSPRFGRYIQTQAVWPDGNERHICELTMVGTTSLLAEAEVCALLVDVLGRLGVQGFSLAVGDMQLHARDDDLVSAAVQRVRSLASLLASHEAAQHLTFGLPQAEGCTELVFNASLIGGSTPFAVGGRYLIRAYQRTPIPAVGLTVDLDQLLLGLVQQEEIRPGPDVQIVPAADAKLPALLAAAQTLRASNLRVEVKPAPDPSLGTITLTYHSDDEIIVTDHAPGARIPTTLASVCDVIHARVKHSRSS